MNETLEEQLEKALPHGSGIDGKWHVSTNNNYIVCTNFWHYIVCTNFWHCMDENGFYDGFIDFTVKFKLLDQALFCPLDFTIHANNWKHNRYIIEKYWKQLGVKEYIEDTIYYAMEQFYKED
jgi:hypothetical protein